MARSSGGGTLRWNDNVARELLESQHGPVARMLEGRGARVEAQAKQNASGRPGPNVITGRGRSSITHVLGVDGRGVYCDVGSGAFYMGIHERRGKYPWLRSALTAAR